MINQPGVAAVYGTRKETPADFSAEAYNATEVAVATGAAMLDAANYVHPGKNRGALYNQYNSANDPMLIAAAARQAEQMLRQEQDEDEKELVDA
ncbi:MAG TPA: hypothetical protein VLF71_00650 [Candidatus Saccharimonadales bacterium]|nr:hypothetical protein [Candidatus Saccharimonadales bacterium]